MDAATLSILMHNLTPILACLFVFGMPVGIVFINKSHKLRMRELELEAQQTPRSTDHRLQMIEERIANIEQALTGSSRPMLPTQDRAAMIEGPPDASRLRAR